jgi:hypothetical protein
VSASRSSLAIALVAVAVVVVLAGCDGARGVVLGPASIESGEIIYRGHVQLVGFTPTVATGQPVGTVGLRLEGVQIWSDTPGVVLAYKAHVQNHGWQPEVQDGQLAGSVGFSLRMEAIQIRLASAGPFSGVIYNVYLHGRGWQGWETAGTPCNSGSNCPSGLCYNGTCAAGTTGQSLSIEALEIRPVLSAP